MTLGRALPLIIAVAASSACKEKTDPSPEARSRGDGIGSGFDGAATVNPRGPNTITRKIIQDKSGDLWLATFVGVVRYDGKTFTNVTNEAGLKPTRAFSLLRDKTNNIWLGTLGGGAYRYDGKSYTSFTTREGLAGDRVLSIMQDKANNIWFGFEGAGATRYDGARFVSFNKSDGFTDGDVSSMAQDSTGRIWFGTREGLFHYDGESFVNFSVRSGLSTGAYVPTLVDRRGHLWFGGANGLHYYDGDTLRQVAKEPTWALLEDDSTGSIWFAGSAESTPMATLDRVDPLSVVGGAEPEIVHVASADGMLFDIFKDKDGHVWVGTLRGIGRLEGTAIRYYSDPPAPRSPL